MKINAKDLTASKISTVRAILIYGTNDSKILSIVKLLLNDVMQVSKEGIIRKNYKESNSETLQNDLGSNMLFSYTLSTVVVSDIGESISKDISDFIVNYDGDNYIIFVGGNLTIRSSFRKLFDYNKKLLSVCVYDNTVYESVAYAKKCLAKYDKKYENSVLDLFKNTTDYTSISYNVDKLISYSLEKDFISFEDAKEVIVYDEYSEIDDMCVAFCYRDTKKVMEMIDKFDCMGIKDIVIIRYVARYFMKLQAALQNIGLGMNAKEAMDKLTPKVFFKYQKDFLKHLDIWNYDNVLVVLNKLLEIEMLGKSGVF